MRRPGSSPRPDRPAGPVGRGITWALTTRRRLLGEPTLGPIRGSDHVPGTERCPGTPGDRPDPVRHTDDCPDGPGQRLPTARSPVGVSRGLIADPVAVEAQGDPHR